MSNSQFISAARRSANEAIAAERGGDFGEAIRFYNNALQQLATALSHEHDETGRRIITSHTAAYIQRVELLQIELEKAPQQPHRVVVEKQQVDGGPPSQSNDGDTMKAGMAARQLQQLPDVHWADIIGLVTVKQLLHTTVVLPREMPHIFCGNRQPARSLLLYGPSGVGKTHIVKALANECKMAFFSFSGADIMDMYQGESEKRVRAMFEAARAAKPSVLFLDEIDALCQDREQGRQGGSSGKVVNQFLAQMDGLGTDLEGVLFIGTTNLPWVLDKGVLSRMERKIYIPLPDVHDRFDMLRYHLGKNDKDVGEPLDVVALLQLARELQHYSARDLATLVRVAQESTVQQIVDATHFRAVVLPDGRQCAVPCDPGVTGATLIQYTQILARDKGLLAAPQLTLQQLRDTMQCIKPVTDCDALAKFEEWTREHGEWHQQ